MLIQNRRLHESALNIDPAYGNALVHLGIINLTMNISLPQTDTRYNNVTVTSCGVDGAKETGGYGLATGSSPSQHIREQ